ncbi:MAG: right-handed parallel beta-helix repeat-containing protein [Bacteroidetes bacterium]|nr:right-handed parallel beta-helix repeat-containing protein [Bacteroidota bacterium]
MIDRMFFLRTALGAVLMCPGLSPLGNAGQIHAQSTYYVNSVSGNDANNGRSSGAAFKTLARLGTEFTNGVPSSTTVYLERGGTYPGSISIEGGASSVSILARGSGDRPIILGSDEVTFAYRLGNAWQRVLPMGTSVRHVYKNDVVQTLARYPNVDAPDNGWLRNQQFTQNLVVGGLPCDQMESPAATLSPAPVGATVVVRATNWSYERTTVIAARVGTIDALLLPNNSPLDLGTYHWGYFLENKQQFLDQNGEWYFDPSTRTLQFYWTGTIAPTGIRAGVRAGGIIMGSGSTEQGILISGIAFKHQTQAAIITNHCDGLTVEDCLFDHVFQGINNDGTSPNTDNTFTDNVFQNIYDRAIRTSADNVTITDNTFTDIGLIPGLGQDNWGYMGVVSRGDNCLIENNAFSNIGYSALALYGSGTARHNYITKAMATFNDGAGITLDMSDGLVIEENIIHDLGDPTQNLISAADNHHAYHQITNGIYFGDNEIVHTTVSGNVITGCSNGIHVDHTLLSDDAVIEDNVLFNNDVQLSMTDYSNYRNLGLGTGNGDGNTGQGTGVNYTSSYNDTYTNNILYCLSEGQRCLQQENVWPDSYLELVDFGDFSQNHYFNPFNELTIWQLTKYTPSVGAGTLLSELPRTLTRWKEEHPLYDVTGNESPLRLHTYTYSLSSPEWVINHDMTSGPGGWDWSAGSCGTLTNPTWVNGPALRSSQCKWISEDANSNITDADNGDYLVRCTITSTKEGALKASAYFVSETSPPGTWIPIGGDTRSVEAIIHVDLPNPSSYNGKYLSFCDVEFAEDISDDLGDDAATITLDDVYLTKVDLTDISEQVAEEHLLLYNNPLVSGGSDPHDMASIALDGTWSDVFGNTYDGTLYLDPWESKVLYRLDSERTTRALVENDPLLGAPSRPASTEPVISVYPNPCNGPVHLVYRIPQGVAQAEIRWTDALGRVSGKRNVAPQDGAMQLRSDEVSTGLHVITLYLDGIPAGHAKVDVVR